MISADGTTKDGRYRAPVTVTSGVAWYIDNELFDLAGSVLLHQDALIPAVTGVVTFTDGVVSLAPRSATDISGG